MTECKNSKHLKGIIMLDVVKALFHNDEIKDKGNFISDFSEILDLFEESLVRRHTHDKNR